MRALVIACLLVGGSCKAPFDRYCDVDTPCSAGLHCDLTGEFNDGAGNVCVPNPYDAGSGSDAALDAAVGPEPPALLAPRNGYYTGSVHADTSLRPTLRWRPVAGVTGYEIQIDDSCASTDFAACDFPSPEVTETTTDPRFTPTDPLDVSTAQPVGARYYWRARACDTTGCGAWSPARYLNVGRQKNDYDGDGYADILVGARRQDGAETDSGMAFLYFGKPTWPPGATIASEELRLVDPSPRMGGFYGWNVAALGDVNSDGYADFAVATIPQDIAGAEGRVDIYFGHQEMQSSIGEVTALLSPGGQTDTFLGARIAGACDIDADGHSDILVSAVQSNPEANEGVTFVYMGKRTWANAVAEPDVTIDNPRDAPDSGFGFPSCGDLNGDGIADVISSAPFMDNPEAGEGAAFVFFGRATWPDEVGTADVEIDGPLDYPGGVFGLGIASGEDINGDGFEDLALAGHEIGNPEPGEGSMFIYFGRDTWQGVLHSADVEVDNPDDDPGGNLGTEIDFGDIDGDGIADVLTGAIHNAVEGKGFVYFGRSGWPMEVAPDLVVPNPLGAWSAFTETVRARGDVNGDGIDDVVLGAFRADAPEMGEGNVFVWLGRSTWGATAPAPDATIDNPDDQTEAWFGSGLD